MSIGSIAIRIAYALSCLVLMMPAQAQTQCPSEPLRPIMRSRTMPPNPGHVHGVTRLEVHIGVDGAPGTAKILHCNPPAGSAEICQSNVTPEMDEQARRYVMTYWRWEMPTFHCEVKAVSTRVNVLWK